MLGNADDLDHFGLAGWLHPTGPGNWHEESGLGWHPDGASYEGENSQRSFSSPTSVAAAAGV